MMFFWRFLAIFMEGLPIVIIAFSLPFTIKKFSTAIRMENKGKNADNEWWLSNLGIFVTIIAIVILFDMH